MKEIIATVIVMTAFLFPASAWSQSELRKARIFVFEKYSTAMKEVARETTNPQAMELSELWENATLLQPVSAEGRMKVESIRQPDSVLFSALPIFKDDTILLGPWKDIFENIQGAKLFSGPKGQAIIIVVFAFMTETWRGLDGLHEMVHAIEVTENPNQAESQNEEIYVKNRSALESSAYEFIAELVLEIGQKRQGALYQKLLNQEAERIQREYAAKKMSSPPKSEAYHMELRDIFGASLSALEDKERETVLWVGGFLQTLRDIPDKEALQRKKEFFNSAVRRKLLK